MAIDINRDMAILGYTSNFPLQNPSNIGHVVLRLSKEGIPLRDFNTTGSRQYYNTQNITTTSDYNYGSTDKLTGIAQFKSGKILLAGNIFKNNETQKEIGLTRLNAKGKIDSTFGVNGRVKPLVGNNEERTKVFLKLDNDKIVMDMNDNTLFRVDSTGKVDSSFGLHGIVRLRLPVFDVPQQIRSLEQQADRKILVLCNKSLLRLNYNGTLDNTFGTNGAISLSNSLQNFSWKKVRVQPDGKIVVAGDIDATTTYLFRCSSSGTPDILFGDKNDGFAAVTVSISGSYELSFMDSFIDFQVLPSGKIIVLCMKDRNYGVPNPINNEIISAGSNYRDIIVYGLTPEGKIDPSFGGLPLRSVYKGTCHFWLPFVEKVPARYSFF